jgi:hypothetical protein
MEDDAIRYWAKFHYILNNQFNKILKIIDEMENKVRKIRKYLLTP